MLSPELSLRRLHPTTACTVRWSFCDSSFAIMVLKAPSELSGSQELRARLAAPGPHGTHPPSHSACGCQPSFRFSAAGLFYPVRFDWPLCFAPTLLISLACTCISRKAALLHARMHAPPTHCSSCARMLRLLSFARTRFIQPWEAARIKKERFSNEVRSNYLVPNNLSVQYSTSVR